MKTRTLVAHHRYFGLDPVRLRVSAGRVLTRVVGLPAGRARVRAEHLCQDFAVDTVTGAALLTQLVDGGLLRTSPGHPTDYELTANFREFAGARVVEPLPRDKARHLVGRAVEIVRDVNAECHRNPLEVEALAVSGSYMTREARLSDLVLGVAVRTRAQERRARFGRMGNKAAGAQEIRVALQALSSFVAVHFVTATAALPRPFCVVFRAES